MAGDPRPLVVHVVYRFDTGGLENGVVNLVNRMTDWRHAIVALTEAVPSFCARVQRDDVEFISLRKGPGHGIRLWPAFVQVLRRLQPQVVHTRNLAALEMQPAAWWAGAKVRIHSEHGRDAQDVSGAVRRYQWLRRAHAPFVHEWIALSRDLASYLEQRVGVASARVTQIYNGVDDRRFAPVSRRRAAPGCPFDDERHLVFGTVGRMQTVKAQPLLVRAFVQVLQARPAWRETLRLVMVGDGPLRPECERLLQEAGLSDLAWLPGERIDVPDVMRSLDLFVLPSLAEGISNTILEAMASGLPVIATDVGGNVDLVADGETGQIVAPGDVDALARALEAWASAPDRIKRAGQAGRKVVERRFGLEAMVAGYEAVYRRALQRLR